MSSIQTGLRRLAAARASCASCCSSVTRQRWKGLPDVPTAHELAKNADDKALLDLAELPFQMARPFLAPPGIPAEPAAILKKAFMDANRDPDYLADAKKLQIDVSPLSGDEVAEHHRAHRTDAAGGGRALQHDSACELKEAAGRARIAFRCAAPSDSILLAWDSVPLCCSYRENVHASSNFDRLDRSSSAVDLDGAGPGLRRREISRSLRTVALGASAGRGPAAVRSDEAVGQGTGSAADARVPGDPGSKHRGSSQRRPRQLAFRRALHAARHAGDDERLRRPRNRRAAGNHLHPDRAQHPEPSPHLHRRARLAGEVEPSYRGYSIGKWIDRERRRHL